MDSHQHRKRDLGDVSMGRDLGGRTEAVTSMDSKTKESRGVFGLMELIR
jgi:hypothetical protein